MNNLIINRVLNESNCMLETNKTVREISKIFNISKSTVHKDLRERLLFINKDLYNKINNILLYHTKIRHFRGGEATKQKYLGIKCDIIN